MKWKNFLSDSETLYPALSVILLLVSLVAAVLVLPNEISLFVITFLKKTFPFYLRITIATLAILYIPAVAIHLVRRSNDHFPNLLTWVPILSLTVQLYFALKCASNTLSPYEGLPLTETTLWTFLLKSVKNPLATEFGQALVRVLDIVYVWGWSLAYLVCIIVLFGRNKSFVGKFYFVLVASYLISGWLHLLIPVLSPIYALGYDAFPWLSNAPVTNALHHSSWYAFVTLRKHGIDALAELSYPIQPVAAFPSLHIAFAYIICRTAKTLTNPLFYVLSLIFLGHMVVGCLVLGYHWGTDIAFGIMIPMILYSLCERKIEIRSEVPAYANN